MQLPWMPDLEEQQPLRHGVLRYGGSQLGCRLLRQRVAYELDGEHRAEPADVPDLREPLLPGEHSLAEQVLDRGGPCDETLLLDHVEHCQGSGLRHRVADVRARRPSRRGRP